MKLKTEFHMRKKKKAENVNNMHQFVNNKIYWHIWKYIFNFAYFLLWFNLKNGFPQDKKTTTTTAEHVKNIRNILSLPTECSFQ